MVLKVLMQDLSRLDADALLAGFHEDVRPLKGLAGSLDWVLCGALSRLIIEQKVRGAVGDVALLTSNGKFAASKIFLVGFGPRAGASPSTLRAAARSMAASAVAAGVARAVLDCFPLAGEMSDEAVAAVREGLADGAGTHPVDFALLAPDPAAFDRLTRLVRA
jgi:hypothetical protein